MLVIIIFIFSDIYSLVLLFWKINILKIKTYVLLNLKLYLNIDI